MHLINAHKLWATHQICRDLCTSKYVLNINLWISFLLLISNWQRYILRYLYILLQLKHAIHLTKMQYSTFNIHSNEWNSAGDVTWKQQQFKCIPQNCNTLKMQYSTLNRNSTEWISAGEVSCKQQQLKWNCFDNLSDIFDIFGRCSNAGSE